MILSPPFTIVHDCSLHWSDEVTHNSVLLSALTYLNGQRVEEILNDKNLPWE